MLGDGHLLLGDIARQANLLHAVEQRTGDRVQGVGGADEEHLRQVQPHIEIVIEEVDVLLGVEHLEQRRGRIALEGLTHLVDLVEHDHRVLDFHFLERLDQLAGHGADIGAPVALDLGLIAHAAYREAVELATQRLGDGATHRGLADPGGPTSIRIEPPTSPLKVPSARNSTMRSLHRKGRHGRGPVPCGRA